MLTPKQIRIFEVFQKQPFREFTYQEIKGKESSNSLVQNAISQYIKEDLIIKRSIANINLYRVNLDNDTVFSYFGILFKESLSRPLLISLDIIKKELGNEFASVVIFGSYAENKQTKKSDVDIAVFAENKEKVKRIMNSAELKTPLKLDHHVFTKKEMLQMLKEKQENLGKQIAKKHLAVYNRAIFYSILKEGINNGFKIIY